MHDEEQTTEAAPLGDPRSSSSEAAGVELRPGDRVDHYVIRERLGEGGFAIVYSAEQHEPVHRQVALKIIKPGMDTRQVIARFEAERQALAMMDHPNVAKVFDAGATENGRPYFVMEHVAGTPITDYCDRHRLDIDARLRLFNQVCMAIQHAHQKAIIHRDVKPSNVLVAVKDAEPLVKVIDFGVAKAISRRLTEKTLYTEQGQLIGTPEYMSPEQAEMTPENIDTRSDIYALGVLLYELLIGALPFDPTTLRQAAFGEIQRIIREVEPARPSTRFSTLAGDASRLADKRHVDPKTLVRKLRGDLDWITMRALEKDRTRRYPTASEFAADIERHLRDEPVVASPPRALYRVRKFVDRHRLGVAATLVVTLAVLSGVGGTLWQASRAGQAEQALELADAFGRFFAEAFASLEAREGSAPNALVRDLLDDAAADIESKGYGRPEVRARLRWAIGNGYKALTLFDEAERHLAAALAMQQALRGNRDPDVAQTMEDLAATRWFRGKFAEAEALFRDCLEIRRDIFGPEHEVVARSMNHLAASLNAQKKYNEAEDLYRQSLDTRVRLFGDGHELVARSRNNLATCLMSQKRFDEAETLFREAVAVVRSLRGDQHIDVAGGLTNLAWCLSSTGRNSEAEQCYREALAIKRRALGDDHESVAYTLSQLARLWNTMERFDEAERACREALEIRERKLDPTHPGTIGATALLADILANKGDWSAAELINRKLLNLRRAAYGDKDVRTSSAITSLARCLQELRLFDEAATLLERARQQLEAEYGTDHERTEAVRQQTAALYEAWGKPEKVAEP